jgi:hypothetical protein
MKIYPRHGISYVLEIMDAVLIDFYGDQTILFASYYRKPFVGVIRLLEI